MMLAYLIKLILKTFQTASSSAVFPLTLHLFQELTRHRNQFHRKNGMIVNLTE